MENVLSFSKRCREETLKFSKKILRFQMLWVIFNITLVVFDWHTFINSPSHLTAFSFGAMCITLLWSFVFMLDTWHDIRRDQLHLKYLNELEANDIACAQRESYSMAKQSYEQLIENLRKENSEKGI